MDGTRLFQVKGTSTMNTRAVQVEEEAASLNTNDCFVLETPVETYIWYGKVSSWQPFCCLLRILWMLHGPRPELLTGIVVKVCVV